MRFPCKYLIPNAQVVIFYGLFWKKSSARVCASASLAAHTVTMATPPTISTSKGTAPSKQKSLGTGTLTTNCCRRLILWIICSIVFTIFAPVSTCYTCFFNTTNNHGPYIRRHKPKHGTVNKPLNLDHAMRPITAYIRLSIKCSYACPCLRR